MSFALKYTYELLDLDKTVSPVGDLSPQVEVIPPNPLHSTEGWEGAEHLQSEA